MYNCTYVETLLPEYDDSPASICLDSELAIVCPPPSLARFPPRPAATRPRNPGLTVGARLDILASLPPEIAVYVLRHLHPRHLCR